MNFDPLNSNVGRDSTINVDVDRLCLPHKLRPYQIEGVNFLVHNHFALLADDMGLGKTIQCIVAISAMEKLVGWRRILIVVPRALKRNWKQECDKWAPTLRARFVKGAQEQRTAQYLLPIPVLIATYDQIRLDQDFFLSREIFDLVVLDEAQRIKNPSSQTSLACGTIPRSRSWALTGTPLENDPDDLAAIFSFLKPGLLQKGMPKALMQSRIEPYFLRRTMDETLPDLPEKIEQTLELDLEQAQDAAYQAILSRWDENEGLFPLLTRLKIACNFDPDSGASSKLEALSLILENLPSGAKALVFSQYVRTLRWLASSLNEYNTVLFHGGLDDEQRETVLRSFRQTSHSIILLMSLKAGGVGLNLQEADVVVLFDRWWNPAVEEQAIRRAYRFGRDRPLQVFKFVVLGTVEERVVKIIERKQDYFDGYVNSMADRTQAGLSDGDLRWILGLD